MPYKKKKTGTKKVTKTRTNPSTGVVETYEIDVDVFSDVWESSYDSGSSSYDSGSSSYDSGSSYSGE